MLCPYDRLKTLNFLVATETGLSFEEAKRFVAITCDEAGDKIKVTTTLLFDSWDQQFAMLED